MGDCGTISIVRFVAILAFAILVIAGSRADAQVFKPRGGKATTAKTAKKPAAEKAEKPAADKPTKKARVAKNTPAKKKSRAADSGRPSDLTPAPKKDKKKGRASKVDDDDEVASSDAGDDEVIITDDDD